MDKQLVIFELGGEAYGVDIAIVEGIVKMQAITRMPHAPEYVEGVTNLRGSVLPVINLEKRFGIPPLQETHDTRIMIILMGGTKVGMIVDSVSEVLMIDESMVEPAPSLVSSTKTEFITGIAKIGTRLVMLLDLVRVFSAEDPDSLPLLHS
jgi:purine-binding chemotaxis protein CheW